MEQKQPIFVAYTRVSTEGQGLGLQGQMRVINNRIKEYDGKLIAPAFKDKISGKENEDNRPGLKDAIELCQVTGATLIVQALDRLSRDLYDCTRICFKMGIKVIACDLSDDIMSDSSLFGFFAGRAQSEREKQAGRVRRAVATMKETHLPTMAQLHAEGRDEEAEAYWKANKSPRSRVSYQDWVRKGFKLGTPHDFTESEIKSATEARAASAGLNEKRNNAAVKAIRAYLADPANDRTLRAIEAHLKALNIQSPKGTQDEPKYYGFKSIDNLCKKHGITR